MNYLLKNEQIVDCIINGYLIIKPKFKLGFHESMLSKLDALNIPLFNKDVNNNPTNANMEQLPEIQEVWDQPEVKGVLASLLGRDCVMNSHIHCHLNVPGYRSQAWHQDFSHLTDVINRREHKIKYALGMYYPQTVTKDMGPTALVPGTHFRNAPLDRMESYGKFKGQVLATVDAGSILILHYDIWHASTANTGNKARYMLKSLFDRKSDPVSPSWDYDPDTANKEVLRFNRETVCGVGTSDFPKEWRLRREMWNYLIGETETKELLNLQIKMMRLTKEQSFLSRKRLDYNTLWERYGIFHK